MGLLPKRKQTMGELDESLEKVKVEEEIATHEANKAEKEAIIKQLKSQYGFSWKSILGVKGDTDTTTLRSMLKNAKSGMEKSGFMSKSTTNTMQGSTGKISVLPGRGITRA